jgi:hypothetical protein
MSECMISNKQISECQWQSQSGNALYSGVPAQALGVQAGPQLGRARLFADAELGDDGFIPLRVVLLEVVEQATTPADHHEKSAARAVILLVRFEMIRELTDALA